MGDGTLPSPPISRMGPETQTMDSDMPPDRARTEIPELEMQQGNLFFQSSSVSTLYIVISIMT